MGHYSHLAVRNSGGPLAEFRMGLGGLQLEFRDGLLVQAFKFEALMRGDSGHEFGVEDVGLSLYSLGTKGSR